MCRRKFPGVFNTDAFEKKQDLEFYFKPKRCKVVKKADFEYFFFDSNSVCTYCPSFGVHCDFALTTCDLKQGTKFGIFLEHLKETEVKLGRYLVKLVGTKFPTVGLVF